MSLYVPELDGVRAVAVLLVVAAHMHTTSWDGVVGWLGVYIFFVLSGYLITSLALKEEANTGNLNLTAFYIRRIFRIFPLYYLILATYCVLIFGLGMSPEKRPQMAANMPYYLTYFQEVPFFRGKLGTFGQSWSLGIEEKFYLLWPLIGFLLLRHKNGLRLLFACSVALILPLFGESITPYTSILIGCALAVGLQKAWLRNAVAVAGSAGVYICMAVLLAMHFFVVPRWESELRKLLYSAVVALFLAFILHVPTTVNRVLASSVFVFVGKISYGIYLVHFLCLNFAEKLMHNHLFASFLLTIVFSVATAYVLHITVEKPLIHMGRKLAARS
jgi:peptidoglycan/LPS O-acetylase OafA/YrhL